MANRAFFTANFFFTYPPRQPYRTADFSYADQCIEEQTIRVTQNPWFSIVS